MEKREILLHVAELFDLPADLAAGLPHLELLGDRELFLESHKGILAYSETAIDIHAGAMTVRVLGSGLKLIALTDQEIRVGGKIDSVQFLT